MTDSHTEGDWGGPYLSTAFFCETILTEQQNVPSYIRVVDRVTYTPQGVDLVGPGVMPPMSFQCYLVVSFKSGKAKGRHDVHIRVEPPSGIRGENQVFPLFFEGEDRGAAINIQLNLILESEGLYWFDVLMGGRLMTRMPLRVIYLPVAMSQS